MTKFPRATGREVVRALTRLGFEIVRTKGSHFYLFHSRKGVLVTVPVHAGRTLAPKTLRAILRRAEVSVEDFKKAL